MTDIVVLFTEAVRNHSRKENKRQFLTECLTVTDGGNIGKCGRLSQPSWLLVRTVGLI